MTDGEYMILEPTQASYWGNLSIRNNSTSKIRIKEMDEGGLNVHSLDDKPIDAIQLPGVLMVTD